MVLSENKLNELVEHVSNLTAEIRNRINKMDARLDALESKISRIQGERPERPVSEERSVNVKGILNGTVKEVQTQIRGLKSPDYGAFLDAERSGRNRKTVKDWLRKQITRS